MEISWHTNELVIATMEQYVTTMRETLDLVKTDFTRYLGPHAIEAIANYPSPPPLSTSSYDKVYWKSPRPIPIAPGSPPELVERMKRVYHEFKRQAVEAKQMEKVREHMKWMWGWAYYSPMRHHVSAVISILALFFHKYAVARNRFETGCESLLMKLVRSDTTPCAPSATSAGEKDEETKAPTGEAMKRQRCQ